MMVAGGAIAMPMMRVMTDIAFANRRFYGTM